MSMVCGLDLHRQQITFDALADRVGEVWRGRVWQPDRERFRRWLTRRRRPPAPTGSRWRWRWRAAPAGATWWKRSPPPGSKPISAEPADTQAARGKQAARQDRPLRRSAACASCCSRGELPESWIPPTAVLEWRERVRLYKSLVDQRRVWTQRIHAELFQHGVAVPEAAIRSATDPSNG